MTFRYLLEDLLTELSADEIYQKYYSKIPYDDFLEIVSADPQTQTENGRVVRMGKYAKLLIALYQRGGMRIEDTDKAKEYLEHVNEHKLALDLNKIKELGDLYNLVKGYIAQDAKTFHEVLGVLSTDEYKVLYDGVEWTVYQPLTEKAACYLGVNTEWCTAWGPYSLNKKYRDRGNHFASHNKKGPLYILVKKTDPDYKFQFHFESKQYMDKNDHRVNPKEFIGEHADILNFFFPSFKSKVSNEQINKELGRLDLLPEELGQKLMTRAMKQIKNRLVIAIINEDEQTVNKLIKDDENLKGEIEFNRSNYSWSKSEKIIFTYGSRLTSEMDNVKNNASYYFWESRNGYDFIYNDIRDRDSDDDIEQFSKDYLKPFYEENKDAFKFNYGIRNLEEFYAKFLNEFVDNKEVRDAYYSDVADLSSGSYESQMSAEYDKITDIISIDENRSGAEIEISIAHFTKYLLTKNITKIEFGIDEIISDFIDFNHLDHEFEYGYDWEITYPDYAAGTGYYMKKQTDKFFEKYIDDSEIGNACLALREKFYNILVKFFGGQDWYETDQFVVKLKDRQVDCSDGTVRVVYVNKMNGETYGKGNDEPDKVKVDNLVSLLVNKKLFEQRVGVDKSGTPDIIKSFQNQGHYKWFDYLDPKLQMSPDHLDYALKYGLEQLTKHYGYSLKRVVIRDKGQIVGFLIWSDNPKEIDDIGDNQNYQVLLATAIHPEYRNRGLLRKMIQRAGLQKPYLVQTSAISPIGLWEKMGCKKVKNLGDSNFIEKCN